MHKTHFLENGTWVFYIFLRHSPVGIDVNLTSNVNLVDRALLTQFGVAQGADGGEEA